MSTAEFDDSSSTAGLDEPNMTSGTEVQTAPGVVKAVEARPTAGVVAPEKRGQIYTMHAFEGVNASELINSALKKRVVGKALPRRVEVAAPSGPSTAGGRKARQSITLVPVSGQGQAIMIGFLDVAQKTAGLRDYELVARQYKARFRSRFETSHEEYQGMIKDLTGMLTTLGFKLIKEEQREEGKNSDTASLSPREQTGGNRNVLLIAAGAVIVVLIALLAAR